jgi:hypothetical protein
VVGAEGVQGFTVSGASLELGEPGYFLPETILAEHREDRHAFSSPSLQVLGDLRVEGEFRGQGARGDQEDGHVGVLDLVEPFVAGLEVTVRPNLEESLVLEAEVLDQTVLPDLVLTAIGDKDAGDGHS